ncbi:MULTISPECIES: hypothetical protein [Phenylobacterium]|uniref:Uncharacterized protein n=1 Tax=Phenylobacterium koreense TaxID=266125 RepID=A0ABV2EEU3_9CAUL
MHGLESVFANAAIPQKIVLVLLLAALPGAVAAATLALRSGKRDSTWRRIVADLRTIGPATGLLVAGLNTFHMGQTIQRLPFDPALKQLTPGIFEVSMFVSLGSLVGLVAAAALAAIELRPPRT